MIQPGSDWQGPPMAVVRAGAWRRGLWRVRAAAAPDSDCGLPALRCAAL